MISWREGKLNGRGVAALWKDALKFMHMGTNADYLGLISVVLVGKYAVEEATRSAHTRAPPPLILS